MRPLKHCEPRPGSLSSSLGFMAQHTHYSGGLRRWPRTRRRVDGGSSFVRAVATRDPAQLPRQFMSCLISYVNHLGKHFFQGCVRHITTRSTRRRRAIKPRCPGGCNPRPRHPPDMASTSSFRRDRLTSVILPVLTTLFVLLANLHGVQAHRPFVHRASNDTPTVQKPQIDNFIVKGLKEHTPQTRYYDFVVSQMNGAPDGFVKPMLVVNGKILQYVKLTQN